MSKNTKDISNAVERYGKNYLLDLDEYPLTISSCYDEENYPYVARNISNACGKAINLGMLYFRFHRDIAVAFEMFHRGTHFAKQIEDLLNTIERTGTNKTIDSGQFCLPIFCALLAGGWELTRQLALWSREPAVKMGNPHDTVYIERLLAALILGKDSEIEVILNDEAKVLKRRAPVYASYFDLIVAASGQDQALFDQELSRVEEEFRARSKSRADVVNGYGYGKIDNALNFDFMAVGICKIAAKRGLITQIDSEYIPKVIVDFWQERRGQV